MKNVDKRPRAWGEWLVCPIAVRLPCRSGHPASSSGLFYSILGFRLGCGLPLHVLSRFLSERRQHCHEPPRTFAPKLTAIPANLLNEGLAATDGKQYSFFVRN